MLRPPIYGDDYPRAEFEVDIEVKCVKGSTEVDIYVQFELSDPDLRALVDDGAAQYVLLIKSSQPTFAGVSGPLNLG